MVDLFTFCDVTPRHDQQKNISSCREGRRLSNKRNAILICFIKVKIQGGGVPSTRLVRPRVKTYQVYEKETLSQAFRLKKLDSLLPAHDPHIVAICAM